VGNPTCDIFFPRIVWWEEWPALKIILRYCAVKIWSGQADVGDQSLPKALPTATALVRIFFMRSSGGAAQKEWSKVLNIGLTSRKRRSSSYFSMAR
jgi:hypothetical protein